MNNKNNHFIQNPYGVLKNAINFEIKMREQLNRVLLFSDYINYRQSRK